MGAGKRTSRCLAELVIQRMDRLEAALGQLLLSTPGPGCWPALQGSLLRADAPEFVPYVDELSHSQIEKFNEWPGITQNVFDAEGLNADYAFAAEGPKIPETVSHVDGEEPQKPMQENFIEELRFAQTFNVEDEEKYGEKLELDPPVVQQRQAPMIQTVRKFVDVPHVQFMIKHWIDEAEEVPVMQYGDEIEEEEDGSDEYPWDPYAEDYAEKMRRFYATHKEELKQYMPDGAFSESGEENDDEEESGSDDDAEFQAELMWLQEEQRRNARATRRVHFDDASDEGG